MTLSVRNPESRQGGKKIGEGNESLRGVASRLPDNRIPNNVSYEEGKIEVKASKFGNSPNFDKTSKVADEHGGVAIAVLQEVVRTKEVIKPLVPRNGAMKVKHRKADALLRGIKMLDLGTLSQKRNVISPSP